MLQVILAPSCARNPLWCRRTEQGHETKSMSVDTQKHCPLPCHTCPDPDTEQEAAYADGPRSAQDATVQVPLTACKICRAKTQGRWATPVGRGPTSDDAEELLDAEAGVDSVEEPLHVAAPATQCVASLGGCGPGWAILQEYLAQPADHPLDPLLEEHRFGEGRN